MNIQHLIQENIEFPERVTFTAPKGTKKLLDKSAGGKKKRSSFIRKSIYKELI